MTTMTTGMKTGKIGSDTLLHPVALQAVSDMTWSLTPKHVILSDTAAKRVLKSLNISLSELPLIRYRDAAIQQLIEDGVDIKMDDVVQITRKSMTSGEVYYYRRVVP